MIKIRQVHGVASNCSLTVGIDRRTTFLTCKYMNFEHSYAPLRCKQCEYFVMITVTLLIFLTVSVYR